MARHLCTTLGTLAYDSNNFCISLKYDSKVNYDPHKYLMNFPMAHITVADSTTKIYLHFYIVDTVDVEMKEIGRRRIPSRDLSNSHLTLYFYCTSNFLASAETSDSRCTARITSLDQSILM